MYKLLTFLFIWFQSYISLAQSSPNSVGGTVKDVNNDVIPGATVRLLYSSDSTLIKGAISDGKGIFEIKSIDNGTYLLSISAVGHKQYDLSFNIDDTKRNIVLPIISMMPADDIELKEVVVKSKRPLIEQQVDRTVVNVESMISAASSNAIEVLEKTPGVVVNANGQIALNGRGGVLVLIDDRHTYMSAQDLHAYLKSIPGGTLDKIELMDNPPARYDAAGSSIINIRLKKSKKAGFTGNMSSGYSQGEYARSNTSLNLNYKYNQLNLFGNLGYSYSKDFLEDFSQRRFYTPQNQLTASLFLNNTNIFKYRGLNGRAGIDYAFSEHTTYGILVNINETKGDGRVEYSRNIFDDTYSLTTNGMGSTKEENRRNNLNTAMYLIHQFNKKGNEISADLNYIKYKFNGNQYIENFTSETDGAIPTNENFLYQLPSNFDIYAAKVDYVHPLKNNLKVETGIKSSIVENNNKNDFYTVEGSIQTIDNGRTNHFNYKEQINAAYINATKGFKRLAVQAGLRIENTQSKGTQLGNSEVEGSTFTKNYTRVFPSLFVNYKLDTLNKNTLNFSISQRIKRPDYGQFNPFLFFEDINSYSSGNPLLDPQYQSRYEIKFLHKSFLRMGLSYNRFRGSIFEGVEVVDDIFITKPVNFGKAYMLLLNNGVSIAPASWWNLNVDVLLSHVGLQGVTSNQAYDFSTFIARINIQNQFSFNKGWSAEFGSYYASNDFNGQIITNGMFRMNAGIQKKILKDKGSVRLSFDDIFHSWVYENKSRGLKQAQMYQTLRSDTQRIGFAFTYLFGNDKFTRKSNHKNNALEEEKGRVGN